MEATHLYLPATIGCTSWSVRDVPIVEGTEVVAATAGQGVSGIHTAIVSIIDKLINGKICKGNSYNYLNKSRGRFLYLCKDRLLNYSKIICILIYTTPIH